MAIALEHHINNLFDIRTSRGYSRKLLAKLTNTTYVFIQSLENDYILPLDENNVVIPEVNRIAEILNTSPEELFPNFADRMYPSVKNLIQNNLECITQNTISQFSRETTDEFLDIMLLRKLMEAASKKLTKRQKIVLYHRFWLDSSLDEIGKLLSLTKERIRQIEARALRILRIWYIHARKHNCILINHNRSICKSYFF